MLFAWHWGGRVGLVTSAIIWNLVILGYLLYSSQRDYVIGHLNVVLYLFLLFFKSPRDEERKVQQRYRQNRKKIIRNKERQIKRLKKKNKELEVSNRNLESTNPI